MVSDTKGDEEAKDDLRVGIGSVQKRVHVVAGIVGSDNKPPTSAPRDTWVSFDQYMIQVSDITFLGARAPLYRSCW